VVHIKQASTTLETMDDTLELPMQWARPQETPRRHSGQPLPMLQPRTGFNDELT
jgi:hypothetical protein